MTSREGDLRSARISSDDLPERDRVEAFRELFGRTILRIEMDPMAGHPLDVDLTLRALPGLGMASGTLSPMRNRHTSELADNDDLVLVVVQKGKTEAKQRAREANVSDGQAILTANGEPGTFTGHSQTRLINFRLSRDLLKPQIEDFDAALVRPIPEDTPALQLLVAYAGVLNEQQGLATPELRHSVVTHIHDLAALALGATRDATEQAVGRGMRAARLRAIKADILSNLGHRDLSVSSMAVRHRVTPRYVQMLFEAVGTTFSEFVLGHRLARAYRLLIDPRCSDVSVGAIAYESGFGDLSYFNRVFRRRYGDTRTGVRASRGPARNDGV